jgi:predicted transcriptional regulator
MGSAVSIRLPENLKSRLENLAKATGRSKTYYMLEAIRETEKGNPTLKTTLAVMKALGVQLTTKASEAA